ncbi:hypothetical protein [Actimicrobium antarcticum]
MNVLLSQALMRLVHRLNVTKQAFMERLINGEMNVFWLKVCLTPRPVELRFTAQHNDFIEQSAGTNLKKFRMGRSRDDTWS